MPNLDIPSHPDAKLQRLKLTDAETLAALHEQCFAGRMSWSAAEFSSLLSQNTCMGFALVEKHAVLAFALYQGIAPETELLTMCTDPNHRRQKLAINLLATTEKALAGAGFERILLDVSEANAPARNLYERLGFVGISERKGYYNSADGNASAIIMAKDIAGHKGPEGPFSRHGPS